MAVDIRVAAATYRARAVAQREQAERRASELVARLPRARQVLVEKYGATRAELFGSLATGAVSMESDVDIAVGGLQPRDYFNALADLIAVFKCAVDLVRIEEAPPSLVERISAEGRPL